LPFSSSGGALNIHNRARILRKTPEEDKSTLHTLAEKKHRLNATVYQAENSSTISNRLPERWLGKSTYHGRDNES
jgi:hypothetical protein